MTSMRSVSPEGSQVQSLSEHNSVSSCEIVGFINNENNRINMQNQVLEYILLFIAKNFFHKVKV